MIDLEERLRSDLGDLADALLGATGRPPGPASVGDGVVEHLVLGEEQDDGQRRPGVVVAAACLVVVALLGVVVLWRASDGRDPTGTATDATRIEEVAAATVPIGHGEWQVIADAPVEARSFPVAGWFDGEIVLWAGSNPSRSFAHTDGAAYDPETGSWRPLEVPGWGHPGLTAAVVDGGIVALAKGSATWIDPSTGSWTEMAPIDGALLVRVVGVDGELFGLGIDERISGDADLVVARYDRELAAWERGAALPFPGATVTIDDVWDLSSPVLWTGEQIVVWGGAGAHGYDPVADRWSPLPALVHPDGRIAASTAAVAAGQLTVVAEVVEPTGRVSYRTAQPVGDGWAWSRTLLPVVDLDQVSVAEAGNWLVLFEPDLPPVTLHVPSGSWEAHLDGPLGGLTGAATVWTGSELFVWGGVASPTSTVADPATGAIWTPPDAT